MRLGNIFKKGTIATLAFVILISSAPNIAQAARYKDVPEMINQGTINWAFEHVEKATDLGYFKGDGQGKFLPAEPLTFDQAISLLGRFTNPNSEEKIIANSMYGDFLRDLNVTTWAREDMAVAMYNDIVSMDQVRSVYEKKLGDKAITKVATSMYLVRAMGLTEEANNKSMVSLTYRDALSMSTVEMKYLSVLIDVGVLDPKGSGDGLFEPKSSLRRDVMAKMMATAHNYLDKNPDKVKEPSKPADKEETEVSEKINGIIINPISIVGSKNFITIDKGKGLQDAYEVLNNTSITLDGADTNYLSLAEGQEVELTVKKDTRETISIKALSVEENLSGSIKNLNSSTNKLTLEHIVDEKTLYNEYTVDKDAYIYLDSEKAKLNDLNIGDKVKVKAKNGVIYDIEAEAKIQKLEGIISELSPVKDSRDKEYNITILDSKEKSHKFIINEDTLIFRDNRKTYEVTDLKLKDEAYIIAEYGVALELDAQVVKKRVKGIIIGKTSKLHQKTELTIFNKETKKEEVYMLGQTPYIRVDGKITNALDLNVGYSVNLYIEGDEIVELDADSKAADSTIMGTVAYINTRNMEMIITIDSFSSDVGQYGDEITVYVKADAVVSRIVGREIQKIDLSVIRKGDIVNVIGNYDGNSLIADTIQLR